jgi:hypothetical protein
MAEAITLDPLQYEINYNCKKLYINVPETKRERHFNWQQAVVGYKRILNFLFAFNLEIIALGNICFEQILWS